MSTQHNRNFAQNLCCWFIKSDGVIPCVQSITHSRLLHHITSYRSTHGQCIRQATTQQRNWFVVMQYKCHLQHFIMNPILVNHKVDSKCNVNIISSLPLYADNRHEAFWLFGNFHLLRDTVFVASLNYNSNSKQITLSTSSIYRLSTCSRTHTDACMHAYVYHWGWANSLLKSAQCGCHWGTL